MYAQSHTLEILHKTSSVRRDFLLYNRSKFRTKLLRRFEDSEVFVEGCFLLRTLHIMQECRPILLLPYLKRSLLGLFLLYFLTHNISCFSQHWRYMHYLN